MSPIKTIMAAGIVGLSVTVAFAVLVSAGGEFEARHDAKVIAKARCQSMGGSFAYADPPTCFVNGEVVR